MNPLLIDALLSAAVRMAQLVAIHDHMKAEGRTDLNAAELVILQGEATAAIGGLHAAIG